MNFDPVEPEDDGELFQMTAMVDVVFILLAFFVLSVQFHGGERDMLIGHTSLGPPAGSVAEDFPPTITVRLLDGGEGAVRIEVGERRLTDGAFGEIRALLDEIDMPGIPVVVAAQSSLAVQDVASALDAVLMSSVREVSLSRLPGEDQ